VPLKIDHIVILVNDLSRAVADYSALGFTVVSGGEHADGVTENALVGFADGSYLELIHFKRPAPEGHFFARGYRAGEGVIAYALVPSDIGETMAQARERGLEMDGPRVGGRTRPDGMRLEWKIGTPPTPDLPFLCADVTPREMRVPGGKAAKHANGVTGTARVTVAAKELSAGVARYSALLGAAPAPGEETPGSRTFRLGDARITLVDESEGAIPHILSTRGEGPYQITLLVAGGSGADEGVATGRIHPAEAHGALIQLVYHVTE